MAAILPEEIQAARLRLVKDRPYLAAAAWALVPVERPGLKTMAVDMWWRLYFDRTVTTRWTVNQLAGVLYHEISHLLRDHPTRMMGLDIRKANTAADAEINDDLLLEGVELPGRPITPASIGQPEGLLAEEYYAALERAQQSAPHRGVSAQRNGAGGPEAGGTQQEGGHEAGQGQADGTETAQDTASASPPQKEAENGSNSPSTAAGGGQADSAQPSNRGDASGSKAGGPDGSKPGSDGEAKGQSPSSDTQSLSGQPSGSSAQPEASSQPPSAPGASHGAGQDGRELGDGAQIPAPGEGLCGSAATGHPEPWEEGAPGESDVPGVGRREAELIRREVARQILEHNRSRGNVPGEWVRWAEEKLRPKVDWRRELAAIIRHTIADVAGASDYSYRRPSRRQGDSKIVFPSLRQPVPSVAVIVDTSGSISDKMLSQALAEVSGVLKSVGQRDGVHVLAVDAAVQSCRRVFRPQQVKLAGGGGTDMGVGIKAAEKLRPRPEVCIVITDGHTPWPGQPPKNMKVIVALTGDGTSPKWAKTVKITEV